MNCDRVRVWGKNGSRYINEDTTEIFQARGEGGLD